MTNGPSAPRRSESTESKQEIQHEQGTSHCPRGAPKTSVNRLSSIDWSVIEHRSCADTPGVTRDRIFDDANIDDKHFRVVDTGGIEVNSEDPLLNQMRLQTQLAVEEADLIVFVVDGRDGVTEADKMDCQSSSKKPIRRPSALRIRLIRHSTTTAHLNFTSLVLRR